MPPTYPRVKRFTLLDGYRRYRLLGHPRWKALKLAWIVYSGLSGARWL